MVVRETHPKDARSVPRSDSVTILRNRSTPVCTSRWPTHPPFVTISLGREAQHVYRQMNGKDGHLKSLITLHSVSFGQTEGWYATLSGTIYEHTNCAGIGLNDDFNHGADQIIQEKWDLRRECWGKFPHPTDATRFIRLFRTSKGASENIKLMYVCDYGKQLIASYFDGVDSTDSNCHPTLEIYTQGGLGRPRLLCSVRKNGAKSFTIVRS